MNKKENDSGVAIDSTPLLACPWCGELPAMMKAEQQGDCPLPVIVWQVCCNNPDCALNPTTGFHDDEQEAIESWQTRIDANASMSLSEKQQKG